MTTEQQTSAAAADTQHPHDKQTRKQPTRHKSVAPSNKSAPPSKKSITQAKSGGSHSNGASKQDRLLALLRRPSGATIRVCMKASGWQAHSVRGFFAGTVRKKLKLNLVSEVVDGNRIYRIAPPRRKSKG